MVWAWCGHSLGMVRAWHVHGVGMARAWHGHGTGVARAYRVRADLVVDEGEAGPHPVELLEERTAAATTGELLVALEAGVAH